MFLRDLQIIMGRYCFFSYFCSEISKSRYNKTKKQQRLLLFLINNIFLCILRRLEHFLEYELVMKHVSCHLLHTRKFSNSRLHNPQMRESYEFLYLSGKMATLPLCQKTSMVHNPCIVKTFLIVFQRHPSFSPV